MWPGAVMGSAPARRGCVDAGTAWADVHATACCAGQAQAGLYAPVSCGPHCIVLSCALLALQCVCSRPWCSFQVLPVYTVLTQPRAAAGGRRGGGGAPVAGAAGARRAAAARAPAPAAGGPGGAGRPGRPLGAVCCPGGARVRARRVQLCQHASRCPAALSLCCHSFPVSLHARGA